jgi:hypothetical protein
VWHGMVSAVCSLEQLTATNELAVLMMMMMMIMMMYESQGSRWRGELAGCEWICRVNCAWRRRAALLV